MGETLTLIGWAVLIAIGVLAVAAVAYAVLSGGEDPDG